MWGKSLLTPTQARMSMFSWLKIYPSMYVFFKTGCYLAQSYFILEGMLKIDSTDERMICQNSVWGLEPGLHSDSVPREATQPLTRIRTGLPKSGVFLSAAAAVPQEVGRKEGLEHGRHDAWNCWPQPLLAINDLHLDTIEILFKFFFFF